MKYITHIEKRKNIFYTSVTFFAHNYNPAKSKDQEIIFHLVWKRVYS